MRQRAVAIGLIASVALFALLIELSIARYPGGTWFNPRAPGHDIFRNFLCDLTQPVALNGQPNEAGSRFAKAAMIALDVGLLLLWWSIPWLSSDPRGATAIRVLGTISFIGIIGVPLTPSLRLGAIHAAAVGAAALPGVAACALANKLLASSPHRGLFRLGMAILIVAAVDTALYAHHVATGGEATVAQPLLQRIALVLLLIWMIAVAMSLLTSRPREASLASGADEADAR